LEGGNMKKLASHLVFAVCLLVPVFAVAAGPDHTVIYPRLICIVPMIGSGTMQDPFRPLFAPDRQGSAAASDRHDASSEITAFQSVPTDDGKAAIVVFVARSYAAFKPLLHDERVIRTFERNQLNEDDLTKELRKYKKDFDLKMLRVGAL
jgi:hypothetical protein